MPASGFRRLVMIGGGRREPSRAGFGVGDNTPNCSVPLRQARSCPACHDAYMKEVPFYTQIAENYYDNYLLGKMRKG